VLLAAFFVRVHPQTALLPVNVLYGHTECGADAGEGEDQ